jgi:hypothetical protein
VDAVWLQRESTGCRATQDGLKSVVSLRGVVRMSRDRPRVLHEVVEVGNDEASSGQSRSGGTRLRRVFARTTNPFGPNQANGPMTAHYYLNREEPYGKGTSWVGTVW